MDYPTRELLLMRHAEAAGAEPGLGDHGRPLTRRGRRAANCVGRWLEGEGVPDRIVSSTAERARTTARIVADACGYEGPLLEVPDLYLAGALILGLLFVSFTVTFAVRLTLPAARQAFYASIIYLPMLLLLLSLDKIKP